MKSNVFYGWWIVVALTVMLALLGPAAVSVANIFQTPVTNEFNIASSQFAINNFIVLGSGVFLSPAMSNLLNGKHYKKVLIVGIIAFGLGLIGYSFSQNIMMFYLFSLLLGFGNVCTTILPASILVSNWFIDKRGLALSIVMGGLGIGGFLLSPILTNLILTIGWRNTYLSYGVALMVIALPIVIGVIVLNPRMKGMQALGEEKVKEATDSTGSDSPGKDQMITFQNSKNKPFFYALVIGTLVVGIVNNGGLGQFPPAMTQMHSATVASIMVSIYSLVGVVGKLILGHVSDKYGVMLGIFYTALCLAICYILYLFAAAEFIVYTGAFFFGMGQPVGTVMPPLITGAIFKGPDYSKAFGYVQSGQQLGMALGSLAVATMADVSGSYHLSWIVMALGCVLFFFIWGFAFRGANSFRESIQK